MAYQTQWLIPEYVLHLSLQGEISVLEMEAALAKLHYLMSQNSDNEVHVIFDLAGMNDQSDLVEIAKCIRNMRPVENLGWLVTIGQMSPVLTMAFSTAIQIMDKRMRQFTTIQDGIQFLQDMLLNAEWDELRLAAVTEINS